MNKRLKVIVLGSSGQLGRQIVDRLHLVDALECLPFSKVDLNLENSHDVLEALQSHEADVVINCAAYTAVDRAEDEKEVAFSVNAEKVKILAQQCNDLNIWLLHYSTDYVFDGKGSKPYLETDRTNPSSVYGASKLAGENAILNEHTGACVIRTSWLYGDNGHNFVNTMIKLGSSKKEINVVNDQVSSPTYVGDLVDCTLDLIQVGLKNGEMPSGLLHYSNSGEASWFEFAKHIMQFMDLDCNVKPISTEEFGAAAPRPKYSKLDCALIEEKYGIRSRPWQEGLKDCLSKKK